MRAYQSPRSCTTSGGAAAGGRQTALANQRERLPTAELGRLKRRVGQLERALGRKTYELEVAGELSRDWE